MKKNLPIIISIILLISIFPASVSASPEYTEKIFPVIRNSGMENSLVTLRFYETMPNVAYISAADYLQLWLPEAVMQVSQIEPDIYELTSPDGKAVADTKKNTLESPDIASFTNLMGLVQKNMANSYYDGMPFIRFAGIETEPAEVPTFFDFENYHIELFGDGDRVFFPFAVISDMYSDLFYHHSGFNGEKVVMNYSNYDMTLNTVDPSYSAAFASTERPEDLASFTYNELCFAIDHFYGYPGRELLHEILKQQGLDKALDSLGETGALIKKYLKSTNTAEYYAGMYGLYALLFDGGHTSFQPGEINGVFSREEARDLTEQYTVLYNTAEETFTDILDNIRGFTKIFSTYQGLVSLRNQAYGVGETYIKQGDTAICVLNSFNARNQDAWDAFYKGSGPLPSKETADGDAMVIFLDALYQAQKDPDVKNLLIDVSTNTGGSADVVMAIISLITGKSELRYENVLTGQKNIAAYDVDRNFDGIFDESDNEVRFDLNFAVLASQYTFSCGNLFTSLMHDAGYPILGEQTGGGACAVMILNSADGYDYILSSYRMRLIDGSGKNIDAGIPADIQLVNHNKKIEVLVSGYDVYGNPTKTPLVMDDYRSFYNTEVLSRW